MIVWRGWGIAFLLLMFAVMVVNELVIEGIAGPEAWEAHTNVFAGIGLLLGGAVVFAIRTYLVKPPERTLVDPNTGQEVRFVQRHDVFWIDVKWWGVAGMVIGAAMIILGIASGISL